MKELIQRIFKFTFLAILICFVLALFAYWFILPMVYKLEDNETLILITPDDNKQYQAKVLHLYQTSQKVVVEAFPDKKVSLVKKTNYHDLVQVFEKKNVDLEEFKFSASLMSNRLIDKAIIASKYYPLDNKSDLLTFFWDKIVADYEEQGLFKIDPTYIRYYFFIKDAPDSLLLENQLADQELIVNYLDPRYKLCSLALTNTTKIDNLAGQLSTLFEASGLNVIRLLNGDEAEKSTIILNQNDQDNCLYVAQKLQNFFPGKIDIQTDTQNFTDKVRCKIMIVLGQDLKSFIETDSVSIDNSD